MRDPQALIGTEQLSTILAPPSLRVYDCTTYLEPPPPGMLRSLGFAAGHLPGHAAPGFFGKRAVLAATKDTGTVIVNALGPQFQKDLEPSR